MKREDANVGDIVRSKVNPMRGLRYRIVKCLKTVCWVTPIDDPWLYPHNKLPTYKGNRYSIFEKVIE